MEQYEVKKGYRDQDELRRSFNELAYRTFGIEFEGWYQNGFWGNYYIPYSIVEKNRVIANVSVNIMNFIRNGRNKYFIQLGTVMTAEEYRRQGFIGRLMQEIETDYKGKADGMYLFANNSVLEFYPKFGYKRAEEFQYSKEVHIKGERTAVPFPMKGKKDWDQLERAITKSICCSQFEMADNIGLLMFYLTQDMQDNVYYIEELKTYIVAEIENTTLLLHHVISEKTVELDPIFQAFGHEIKHVKLGFTPRNTEGFLVSKVHDGDITLFMKGKGFGDFKQSSCMFPTLSHA